MNCVFFEQDHQPVHDYMVIDLSEEEAQNDRRQQQPQPPVPEPQPAEEPYGSETIQSVWITVVVLGTALGYYVTLLYFVTFVYWLLQQLGVFPSNPILMLI